MDSRIPRFASRLNLSLFKEELVNDLAEDLLVREQFFSQLPDSNSSFSLQRFISQDSKLTPSDLEKVRKSYREFVSEVVSVTDSEGQKDAALTMYNIMTKNPSEDIAFQEVIRYFGTMSRPKMDRIRRMAQELHLSTDQKKQKIRQNYKSVSDILSSYGLNFRFKPSLIIEPEFHSIAGTCLSGESSISISGDPSGAAAMDGEQRELSRDATATNESSSVTSAKALLTLCEMHVINSGGALSAGTNKVLTHY